MKVFFLLIFLTGISAFAQSELLKHELIHGGVKYEYNTVPGRRFNEGEIEISFRNKEKVKYKEVGLDAPGCGEFPALSIIDVEYKLNYDPGKIESTKLVVFCGLGVMKFYNPKIGFVTYLDFYRNKVSLKKSDAGVFYAVVYKEHMPLENYLSRFLQYAGIEKVFYPIVYRLNVGRDFSGFTSRPLMKDPIYALLAIKNKNEFDKTPNYSSAFSLLVSAYNSGDSLLLCKSLIAVSNFVGNDEKLSVLMEELKKLQNMNLHEYGCEK